MNNFFRTLIFFILPSTLFANSFFSHFTISQHQLSTVNSQIQSLENKLANSRDQRDKLQNALQADETKIANIETKRQKTEKELHTKTKKLTKTETQQDKLKRMLATQHELMSQHILSAYTLGRQPELKMVLNQENPETIDRFMVYYRYLVNARQTTIQDTQKTIAALEVLSEKIRKQQQSLLATKQVLDQQKRELNKASASRQKTLNTLNNSIHTKQAKLKKLYNDKNRLQNLVKLLSQKTYYYTPGKNFVASKGLLAWPIKHFTTTQKFHTPIAEGRLYTTGMVLKADAGEPIHAIYPGKVVFAHWLRGYGFLMIIQHGKNTMTLYGRCQNLVAEVGQHVNPGDVIAHVGNSGGYEQPGLYFEIRRYGKAVNPTQWLRKT